MPKDQTTDEVVVPVEAPAVNEDVKSTVAPQVWFFPDILGDGRAISISSLDAKTREEAEQLARKHLQGDATHA